MQEKFYSDPSLLESKERIISSSIIVRMMLQKWTFYKNNFYYGNFVMEIFWIVLHIGKQNHPVTSGYPENLPQPSLLAVKKICSLLNQIKIRGLKSISLWLTDRTTITISIIIRKALIWIENFVRSKQGPRWKLDEWIFQLLTRLKSNYLCLTDRD